MSLQDAQNVVVAIERESSAVVVRKEEISLAPNKLSGGSIGCGGESMFFRTNLFVLCRDVLEGRKRTGCLLPFLSLDLLQESTVQNVSTVQ